jgi:hypothetical protein
MTTVFFFLISWGILTAKTRRQMIAVAAAGAMAAMLVSPPRVYAQGLWKAIEAVLKVIHGIIKTALDSITTVRSAIRQFYQLTVWPRQLINQARSLVTRMISQYRAPMAAIFNTRLESARLAGTQQLESRMRNDRTGDFPALGANYGAVYGALPAATQASPAERTLIDVDDALAQDTLKTLEESDDADNMTLSVADRLENTASQAAPGSAPLLTAAAVVASIRTEALTQKMLAAELRQEAAELAHRNTLRKEHATFTSQVSRSIQDTLQPQR